MYDMTNKAKTILAIFPSTSWLEERLPVGAVTIRQWGNRGNIPSEYWETLLGLAKEQKLNLTVNDFFEMVKQEVAA